MPERLDSLSITSELIRAARALLRWEQRHLAHASGVSLPTIKRLEFPRVPWRPTVPLLLRSDALKVRRNRIHERQRTGRAP